MQLLAQTTSPNYDQAAQIAALLGGGSALLFIFIFFLITVGIYYLIIKKTGYNPWMSLLILIPGIGGLIIIIVLAFTEWPIQRELRELRARIGGGGYGPGPYPAAPPATAYAPGPTATAFPPESGGPIAPA